jgi:hypothetical protein
VVGSVSPNHSTGHETRARILETRKTKKPQNKKDPDDEPPRSRFFVTCPKGVSQEVLPTASWCSTLLLMLGVAKSDVIGRI